MLRSRTAESPSGAEIEVTGGRPPTRRPAAARWARRSKCTTCSSTRPCGGSFSAPRRPSWATSARPSRGSPWPLPQIHFTLRHNERHGVRTGRQRRAAGADRPLLRPRTGRQPDVGGEQRRAVRVSGYVAHPSHSRSNNRMQYLFLNGRHIRDRALQHALGEAYRGLLMTGRFPIAFLAAGDAGGTGRRECPSHQAGGAFPGRRPALQPVAGHAAEEVPHQRPEHATSAPAGDDDPTGGHDEAAGGPVRQQLVDWAKGRWPPGSRRPAAALRETRPRPDSFPCRQGRARAELVRLRSLMARGRRAGRRRTGPAEEPASPTRCRRPARRARARRPCRSTIAIS